MDKPKNIEKAKLIKVPGEKVIVIEDPEAIIDKSHFEDFLTKSFNSVEKESENDPDFVNDGKIDVLELYPDTDLETYINCIPPKEISYEDYYKIVKHYFAINEISFEFSTTVPVALYPILKENDQIIIPADTSDYHTDLYVEEGIKPLIKALMEFPGVQIIQSCQGHYDKNDPTHLTDWLCCAYVVYTVTNIVALNKLTSELNRNFTKMFQHFQLDDREDWAVKKWFSENSLVTSYGHEEGTGTVFEISFRYMVEEQSRVWSMIEYLGSQLQHESKV